MGFQLMFRFGCTRGERVLERPLVEALKTWGLDPTNAAASSIPANSKMNSFQHICKVS
jgi:hypothetical protein